MKVAIKYVKPIQQLNTHSNARKPLMHLFRELKLEVDALALLPDQHPNVAGLSGAVAKFPTADNPNQEVQKCQCFLLVRELRQANANNSRKTYEMQCRIGRLVWFLNFAKVVT